MGLYGWPFEVAPVPAEPASFPSKPFSPVLVKMKRRFFFFKEKNKDAKQIEETAYL